VGGPAVGASADERTEEGLLQLRVAGEVGRESRMRGPHPSVWGDEGWVGGHFFV
jgi:hypothetical protein